MRRWRLGRRVRLSKSYECYLTVLRLAILHSEVGIGDVVAVGFFGIGGKVHESEGLFASALAGKSIQGLELGLAQFGPLEG